MITDIQIVQRNALLELAARQQAVKEFLLFILYTKKNFIINWHHRILAAKLQQFAEGRIKKLMIFLPPQVGKSEMSTRRLPAFMLGRDPDKRIAVAAYNQTFASQFNREIQRIIVDRTYKNLFPETQLNSRNMVTDGNGSYVRNSEIFEVVGKKGFLKTVGVNGPLTGTSVDVGIIDDPIKDAAEAFSSTFRDRVWDWYSTVFLTRLHNDSQQLITLTRWHQDDLAGRILKEDQVAKSWEVIILPAVREDYTIDLDPRELGQALWPERHSLERMLEVKQNRPLTYASLYQQRPYFNEEEGRFAWAFSRQKHVGKCLWDPKQYTYLSFDFNRNPICCTVFQHYNESIYVIRCIKLKESNTEALCKKIKEYYPLASFIITGDATGKASNAMVKDNLNHYKIIQVVLNLNRAAMRQPMSNPPVEGNRVLLNVLLQNYNWVIDEENAGAVILDLEYVKVLPDGSIDKTDRKDPTKQADALDTVRYYCNTFHGNFLKAADNMITPEQRASVPPVEVAKKRAIETIKAGLQVTCSAEHYAEGVKAYIVNEAQGWITAKNLELGRRAITEINRLDKLFGIHM